MILYLTVIIGATIMISIFNIALFSISFFSVSALEILGISIATVIFEIAINGITAFLIHCLPKKWFSAERKLFKVFKWERKFYEKLGIKHWKDKVLELGSLNGFSKNKINDPTNPEYFSNFIIESNNGILDHLLSIFTGFGCCLLFPQYFLTIGLPASIVGAILNILPIFILRYNIPKLLIARERAIRVKERESKQ